jgi:hypothetical protein
VKHFQPHQIQGVSGFKRLPQILQNALGERQIDSTLTRKNAFYRDYSDKADDGTHVTENGQ